MRMILAATFAATVLAATPVDARPRHHAHHIHHRHHAHAPRSFDTTTGGAAYGTGLGVVDAMRRHLGSNPTGWARVWCGRMLDMALRSAGHAPGSPVARAYASYGRPAAGPAPGVIAVWPHHVGVVTAVEGGRIRMISGNDGRRVRERVRSTAGVIAWRVP
ncbi:MAG: TIGR02594 family protein [Rhodoplanes sp.]|uniref:TIGR02594 family protein n=1 Tax=Rhodoplanes sp. TaxID=1968906 RepID=UPI0017F1CBF8|nr:TIGR02594 family protein [Rhodoplanes sp.]NVO13830.1 TIGR02594 family protein [Rhodoplanes sp.]